MIEILIWIVVIGVVMAVLVYVRPFRKRLSAFFHTTTTAETIGGKLEMVDEHLGETESVCPYCQTSIGEMPENHTECPHCGETIYKRKRPYDQQEILVKEDQLERVREQWAIVNGEHEQYLKEQERKKRIAGEMENNNQIQVHRQFLNEQARELEQENNWGMARNKVLERAEYLDDNSEYRDALQGYLEVCYWDANGPQNLNVGNPRSQNRSAFSEKMALLSPGTLQNIADLMEKEGLTLRDIKALYMEAAKETYGRLVDNNIELPKDPEEAWEEFRESVT